MNPEVKAQWVTALRSGDYKQGQGVLRTAFTDGSVSKFCCLGVLCELAVNAGVIPAPLYDGIYYSYGTYGDKRTAYLPEAVMKWAGLDGENPMCGTGRLATLNDKDNSFEQIADAIEVYL